MLFVEYTKPRWATFVKYGKVELAPPGPGDIAAAIPQAANIAKSAMTFKFTQLTVKVNNLAKLIACISVRFFLLGKSQNL